MRNITAILCCCAALAVGACSSGPKPPEPEHGMSNSRQWELEQAFSRVASPDELTALEAAGRIAVLPEDEHNIVSGFWGRRSSNPLVARRIASECAKLPRTSAARAVAWYHRALTAMKNETDYTATATVRLELALAYESSGDARAAVELLANRIDTRPLPVELERRYQDALAAIAAGSRPAAREPEPAPAPEPAPEPAPAPAEPAPAPEPAPAEPAPAEPMPPSDKPAE